ncbi:hypothetical protein AOLI_G00148290 [Acnodon oligacanthus]
MSDQPGEQLKEYEKAEGLTRSDIEFFLSFRWVNGTGKELQAPRDGGKDHWAKFEDRKEEDLAPPSPRRPEKNETTGTSSG